MFCANSLFLIKNKIIEIISTNGEIKPFKSGQLDRTAWTIGRPLWTIGREY